ncbi:hypothetical protein TK36_05445 [Lacticaseibacillus paracasei]|nr:hypothetical protein TK36_05445 [Lacticaseibacillus paracasei]
MLGISWEQPTVFPSYDGIVPKVRNLRIAFFLRAMVMIKLWQGVANGLTEIVRRARFPHATLSSLATGHSLR